MRERTPGTIASLTWRLGGRLQVTRGTRNAGCETAAAKEPAHDRLRVEEGRTGSRMAALVPGWLHWFLEAALVPGGLRGASGCTSCIVRRLIQ